MTISPTAQAPLSPEFTVSGGGTSETNQYEGFSPASTLPPGTKPVQPLEYDTVELNKIRNEMAKQRGFLSFICPGAGQRRNGDMTKGLWHTTVDFALMVGTIVLTSKTKSVWSLAAGLAAMAGFAGYSAHDAYKNCGTTPPHNRINDNFSKLTPYQQKLLTQGR